MLNSISSFIKPQHLPAAVTVAIATYTVAGFLSNYFKEVKQEEEKAAAKLDEDISTIKKNEQTALSSARPSKNRENTNNNKKQEGLSSSSSLTKVEVDELRRSGQHPLLIHQGVNDDDEKNAKSDGTNGQDINKNNRTTGNKRKMSSSFDGEDNDDNSSTDEDSINDDDDLLNDESSDFSRRDLMRRKKLRISEKRRKLAISEITSTVSHFSRFKKEITKSRRRASVDGNYNSSDDDDDKNESKGNNDNKNRKSTSSKRHRALLLVCIQESAEKRMQQAIQVASANQKEKFVWIDFRNGLACETQFRFAVPFYVERKDNCVTIVFITTSSSYAQQVNRYELAVRFRKQQQQQQNSNNHENLKTTTTTRDICLDIADEIKTEWKRFSSTNHGVSLISEESNVKIQLYTKVQVAAESLANAIARNAVGHRLEYHEAIVLTGRNRNSLAWNNNNTNNNSASSSSTARRMFGFGSATTTTTNNEANKSNTNNNNHNRMAASSSSYHIFPHGQSKSLTNLPPPPLRSVIIIPHHHSMNNNACFTIEIFHYGKIKWSSPPAIVKSALESLLRVRPSSSASSSSSSSGGGGGSGSGGTSTISSSNYSSSGNPGNHRSTIHVSESHCGVGFQLPPNGMRSLLMNEPEEVVGFKVVMNNNVSAMSKRKASPQLTTTNSNPNNNNNQDSSSKQQQRYLPSRSPSVNNTNNEINNNNTSEDQKSQQQQPQQKRGRVIKAAASSSKKKQQPQQQLQDEKNPPPHHQSTSGNSVSPTSNTNLNDETMTINTTTTTTTNVTHHKTDDGASIVSGGYLRATTTTTTTTAPSTSASTSVSKLFSRTNSSSDQKTARPVRIVLVPGSSSSSTSSSSPNTNNTSHTNNSNPSSASSLHHHHHSLLTNHPPPSSTSSSSNPNTASTFFTTTTSSNPNSAVPSSVSFNQQQPHQQEQLLESYLQQQQYFAQNPQTVPIPTIHHPVITTRHSDDIDFRFAFDFPFVYSENSNTNNNNNSNNKQEPLVIETLAKRTLQRVSTSMEEEIYLNNHVAVEAISGKNGGGSRLSSSYHQHQQYPSSWSSPSSSTTDNNNNCEGGIFELSHFDNHIVPIRDAPPIRLRGWKGLFVKQQQQSNDNNNNESSSSSSPLIVASCFFNLPLDTLRFAGVSSSIKINHDEVHQHSAWFSVTASWSPSSKLEQQQNGSNSDNNNNNLFSRLENFKRSFENCCMSVIVGKTTAISTGVIDYVSPGMKVSCILGRLNVSSAVVAKKLQTAQWLASSEQNDGLITAATWNWGVIEPSTGCPGIIFYRLDHNGLLLSNDNTAASSRLMLLTTNQLHFVSARLRYAPSPRDIEAIVGGTAEADQDDENDKNYAQGISRRRRQEQRYYDYIQTVLEAAFNNNSNDENERNPSSSSSPEKDFRNNNNNRNDNKVQISLISLGDSTGPQQRMCVVAVVEEEQYENLANCFESVCDAYGKGSCPSFLSSLVSTSSRSVQETVARETKRNHEQRFTHNENNTVSNDNEDRTFDVIDHEEHADAHNRNIEENNNLLNREHGTMRILAYVLIPHNSDDGNRSNNKNCQKIIPKMPMMVQSKAPELLQTFLPSFNSNNDIIDRDQPLSIEQDLDSEYSMMELQSSPFPIVNYNEVVSQFEMFLLNHMRF